MKKILGTNSKELFISFLAITALIIFIPIFTYLYFANDLKTKDNIMNKNDTGVIFLDRNDKPFFTFYQARYRNVVPLTQIPKYMPESVIASEDKDFYRHSGFSLPSLFRALFLDLSHGKILYGGSTITQQLVKNALLNSKKNYLRKVQELILAQEIERRYSKDEILEMYLNSVYFGEGAFGIENASQNYFGKHVKDLSLSEQAFLTAILPSPSKLSPFTGDYKEAKIRQKIVLQKMYEQKYITEKEKNQAESEKLVFSPASDTINATAPHFALMIRDQLIKQYGEEIVARSGFKVKTTIDLTWQKEAEKAVADQVKNLRGDAVTNGAAVVMDPKTGDIKALVGSKDWYDKKFGTVNMATTPRSVGSSFKPIVYSAALEQRLITPATLLHDVPTTYPEGYRPVDFDRKFRGLVTVRRALSNSLNVPAVEVMKRVGLVGALEKAKELGVTSLKEPSYYGQGLSLVLGAGEVSLIEMTDAYATFANGGIRPQPRMILKITDKSNKTVYAPKVKTESALQPEVAFLISSILSDNKARSEEFGNLLNISRPAAVKTGTAEDFKDALTLGYTPSLAIGVWVGNNDNTSMDSVAGSLGAAPIWKNLMEKFLANTPVEAFSPPSGIVQLTGCHNGQKLALNQSVIASPSALTSASEFYIRGTEPQIHCQIPTPTIPSRIGKQSPTYSPNFPAYPNITTYPYQPNQWQKELRQSMQEYRRQLKEARSKQRGDKF
jgi:1A family penicillin-binding protein